MTESTARPNASGGHTATPGSLPEQIAAAVSRVLDEYPEHNTNAEHEAAVGEVTGAVLRVLGRPAPPAQEPAPDGPDAARYARWLAVVTADRDLDPVVAHEITAAAIREADEEHTGMQLACAEQAARAQAHLEGVAAEADGWQRKYGEAERRLAAVEGRRLPPKACCGRSVGHYPGCTQPEPAPAEEGRRQCPHCPHTADERSVYGCADGCACEWMPNRRDSEGRRQQYARAIHRYDYEHALSGNDLPSEHHYGEADAVMAVADAELRAQRDRQAEETVDLIQRYADARLRAEQADELSRIAHQCSNDAEAARVDAEQRAKNTEGELRAARQQLANARAEIDWMKRLVAASSEPGHAVRLAAVREAALDRVTAVRDTWRDRLLPSPAADLLSELSAALDGDHPEKQRRDAAALDRVRALHQQYRFAGDDTTDYCAHCNQITGGWVPWPCPTIRALDTDRSRP
ncbi:hypothetical protein [Streptomyces sp. DH37]|uniref:hypothetical protein n=1 Tax=Streptomyces sp. DH37 TaxID=3040122 RepID=UPI002440F222|nr:hypothetical protein [Streptomyces sp. DH37]MDG9701702.1 hypothetical protein [Streptomyces sp. DH37]